MIDDKLFQLGLVLLGGAGGVALWKMIQYVAGRWFDERSAQAGEDANIRRVQAERIDSLEQRIDSLQEELRLAQVKAAGMEKEIEWLRKIVGMSLPRSQAGGCS